MKKTPPNPDQLFDTIADEDAARALSALRDWLSVSEDMHAKGVAGVRAGTIWALSGVTQFVGARFGNELATPLCELLISLEDLERGVVTPLVQKKRIPGVGNKPPASRDRLAVKHLAVAIVDKLMAEGATRASSADLVAGWLNSAGFKLSHGERNRSVTAETVIHWRQRLRAASKKSREAPDGFGEMVRSLEQAKGTKQQLRRALQSLVEKRGLAHASDP